MDKNKNENLNTLLNLTDLPVELLFQFISYLDVGDRVRVAHTCKLLNSLADAPTFWKRSCEKADISFGNSENYKEIFKKAVTYIDEIYYTVVKDRDTFWFESPDSVSSLKFVLPALTKKDILDPLRVSDSFKIFCNKKDAVNHSKDIILGYFEHIDILTIRLKKCYPIPQDQNEISFYAKREDIKVVNPQFVDQPKQADTDSQPITETIKALIPSCSIL